MNARPDRLRYEIGIDAGSYRELQRIWRHYGTCQVPISTLCCMARSWNLTCFSRWIEAELARDGKLGFEVRSLADFRFRLAGEFNGNLICVRFDKSAPGATVLANVSHAIFQHGREFDFGQEGTPGGTRELALNVLHYFLPPGDDVVPCQIGGVSRSALELHEAFADEAIAKRSSGAILVTKQAIGAWILEKQAGGGVKAEMLANIPVGMI